MKKVSLLFFALISVLTLRGQSESEFNYDHITKVIDSLKNQQPEVLSQFKAKQSGDSLEAKNTLDSIFGSLEVVVKKYDVMTDTTLQAEAQSLIMGFLSEYKKAIYNNDQTAVSISTGNFLKVAKDYLSKLNSFEQKVSEYDPPALGEDTDGAAPKGDEVDVNGDSHKVPVWVWIIYVVGLLGFIIGIYAILAIRYTNIRINHRRDEVKKLKEQIERLTKEMSDLKPSNFRGPSQNAQVPLSQSKPKPKPKSKRQNVHRDSLLVTEAQHIDLVELPKVEDRPTFTNLYATIKVGSPLAEFFKVSSDNTGDKVFMLTLAGTDDETAEFTIAPEMSADFMKSVIVDRDTYLPPTFCERSIDSQNPSTIEVISPGRAKKVEGKWQVQERMSIRLV